MTGSHVPNTRELWLRKQIQDELDDLVDALVDVLDSFDRARDDAGATDPATLLVTYRRIGDQLRTAVAEAGLEAFGAPGDPVDLSRYDVVEVVARADVEADTVVDVVRPGYRKDGRVVRPAEVIVAGQPEEP